MVRSDGIVGGGVPSIDVIIPVHSPLRPLRRAVDSVLNEALTGTKVIVVCHNVSREEIIAASGVRPSPQVEFHELHDGTRSPAGPRNHGISVSSAQYLAFLDSDDVLDAGALGLWAGECVRHDFPDVLIGQVHAQGGRRFSVPSPRVGRYMRLSARRDLLNDRTAPQGVLVSRQLLLSPGAPLYEIGAPIGEDLAIGLFIWNQPRRIAYSRFLPGYQLRADADDRVTSLSYPLEIRLHPIRSLLRLEWFRSLDPRARGAIARKLIRIELLGIVRDLALDEELGPEQLTELREFVHSLEQLAPSALRDLPLWETTIIRCVREEDGQRLARMLAPSSYLARVVRALLPGHVRGLAAPEQTYVRAMRTLLGRSLLRRPANR